MSALTPQSRRLRADLRVLTRKAELDLRELVPFSISDPLQVKRMLEMTLPQLATIYGSAAASVAADWYDELRAEQRVGGRYRAEVPTPPADLGTDALAGFGVGPLFSSDAKGPSRALSLVLGGLQRRILSQPRAVLTSSAISDPGAVGWQRVGSGECAFCTMLLSRGAVYSEASADFAAHDHCACQAEPFFHGNPKPVKPYTPSDRNISDADRARVREYIAAH